MKLRVVKDRSGRVMHPWYVQTERGVTLESFYSWKCAIRYALSLMRARAV